VVAIAATVVVATSVAAIGAKLAAIVVTATAHAVAHHALAIDKAGVAKPLGSTQ